ncbi:MAG: hypothetical protein K2O86_07075 [Clostridia bacterium]|nr:hypothetical protein [Clostridia bacterium]
MRKSSVIILSTLLICFIIVLSVGLFFTSTPSESKVTNKYLKADYSHKHFSAGSKFSIRVFNKDGVSLFIIWYSNEVLAREGVETLSKYYKGENTIILKRGKAVACGNKDAIKIFQLA